MIIGPPNSFAASRQPLIDDDETTLTAGIAYLLSCACCSRSSSALPVTTPGFTLAGSGVAFFSFVAARRVGGYPPPT